MSRRGTETRQRSAQVVVRLNPAEAALVQREVARQRVSAPEVIRRAFFGTQS